MSLSQKETLGEGEDSLLCATDDCVNIIPHSSEGDGAQIDMSAPATDDSQHVNVKFDDAHPGFEDTRGEVTDPLRTELVDPDLSLDKFFGRPIKIAEYAWLVDNKISQTLLPWDLYFGDKRVINRISNYKLMKATLKIKIVINGNSFYFGRALVSYRPLVQYDNTTLIRSGNVDDLVEASQRPHIWLNPTISQGGSMVLPFFTPLNMFDIPNQDWQNMGQLSIESPTVLRHANSGTTSVNISIFAWADDVELVGITQENPGGIVPQGMESEGILSKPASNVAKTASLFTSIPYIGGFARATEIGAGAIGSMAALFGYSKPTTEDIPPFQPLSRQSMATCDGRESLVKLTVDPCNELTIDPKVGSLDMPDEMTILSIASRESFFSVFDWAPESAAETLLFNCVVDPAIVRQSAGSPAETHMTASAFASFPFEYWRGTLRYRFQVVASGFHKGRIKIVYDPFGTPAGGSAEYNTAYTEIIDIAECTDFAIDVGWGQSTPWRNHLPVTQPASFAYNSAAGAVAATPLTVNSSGVNFGNGTLSVYVVNELTVPSTAANNDAHILVSLSACDDFELASPTDKFLGGLGFVGSSNGSTEPQGLIEPQGAEEEILDAESPVMQTGAIRHMGSKVPVNALVNKIHMGETIASFRQLCHRYQLHETLLGTWNSGTDVMRHIRTVFPYDPGYTGSSAALSNLIVDLNATSTAVYTGNYVYAKMTLLNYLRRAYGGWRGSVRYTTDITINPATETDFSNDKSDHASTWSVSRIGASLMLDAERIPRDDNQLLTISFGDSDVMRYELLAANHDSAGISGLTRWNTEVNPIQSYEIPYYSRYRFTPGRRGTLWNGSDDFQDCYELTSTSMAGNLPYVAYQYAASGEDFTYMFYLSPPVFYVQYPVDPTG